MPDKKFASWVILQKITREANFFSVIPKKQTFFFKNHHIKHEFLKVIGQKQTFFWTKNGKQTLFLANSLPPPHKYQMAVPIAPLLKHKCSVLLQP